MTQAITTPAQLLQVIRARRQHLRLTQREVADKLAISQHHLSDLENGRRALDVDRLVPLLSLLNLEMLVQDRKAPSPAEW
jgi:transcriptional regulator with XRE-family HTH domain